MKPEFEGHPPAFVHGCPVNFAIGDWCFSTSWPGASHGCPVELRSNTRGNTGLLSHLVMAARVAAIHVFGEDGKVVDGPATPGHDVQKAPVVNTITNRTAVAFLRRPRPRG